jgi:DNA-binding MarR family transcriptional regulator
MPHPNIAVVSCRFSEFERGTIVLGILKPVEPIHEANHMPVLPQTTSCACAGVRRASRAVSHLYDQVLVPAQIKATQFMILRTIAESGEIAHCDLAAELAASVETLSRRLASARQAGLLRVHVGEHNRRLYSLTPRGRQVLEQATPYWEKAQIRLQRVLGDTDWRLLINFSRRLADAAVEAEDLPLSNGASPHALLKQPVMSRQVSCYSNARSSVAETSAR